MVSTALLTTSAVTQRLAARHGCPVAEGTIRSWVRGGRLHPVAKTASGISLFDVDQVDRLGQQLAEKRAQ